MYISSQFILQITAKILNSLKGNFKILIQIPITRKTITVDAHKSTIHKNDKEQISSDFLPFVYRCYISAPKS
jgi:hypothetical protein